MKKKQEKEKKVYNKDYSLNFCKFYISDDIFTIYTKIGLHGVKNALDTLKNQNTGHKKEMRRSELIQLLKKFENKIKLIK